MDLPVGLLIVWREAYSVITLGTGGTKNQSCGNNGVMRQVCDQHTQEQGWLHLRKLTGSCPAHAYPLSPPALGSS